MKLRTLIFITGFAAWAALLTWFGYITDPVLRVLLFVQAISLGIIAASITRD